MAESAPLTADVDDDRESILDFWMMGWPKRRLGSVIPENFIPGLPSHLTLNTAEFESQILPRRKHTFSHPFHDSFHLFIFKEAKFSKAMLKLTSGRLKLELWFEVMVT